MYELFIITPAINRSELHSICFKPLIENINIKTKWFINIDYISDLYENVEITKKNILEMSNDFIDFEIFINYQPCFFKAIKKIVQLTKLHMSYTVKNVFYLEDDWLIDLNYIDLLIENFKTDKSEQVINFCYDYRKNDIITYISFKPTLWNSEVYNNFFVNIFLDEIKIIDPEKHLKEQFQNKNISIDVKGFNIFSDMGRLWLENKNLNICKWDKQKDNQKITYQKQYDICIITSFLGKINIIKLQRFYNFFNNLGISILWITKFSKNFKELSNYFNSITNKKNQNIDISLNNCKYETKNQYMNLLITHTRDYVNLIKYSYLYIDNEDMNINSDNIKFKYNITNNRIVSLTQNNPIKSIENLYPSIWCKDIFRKTFYYIFSKPTNCLSIFYKEIIARIKDISSTKNIEVKIKTLPLFINSLNKSRFI